MSGEGVRQALRGLKKGVDPSLGDLAEELLASIPGCEASDIADLACTFQDAFEDAADRIEERQREAEDQAHGKKGHRHLRDDEVLQIMRAGTKLEVQRLAERFGVSVHYARQIRSQSAIRSLRLAAKHDVPAPTPFRPFARMPIAGAFAAPGELALIRRIQAGDA